MKLLILPMLMSFLTSSIYANPRDPRPDCIHADDDSCSHLDYYNESRDESLRDERLKYLEERFKYLEEHLTEHLFEECREHLREEHLRKEAPLTKEHLERFNSLEVRLKRLAERLWKEPEHVREFGRMFVDFESKDTGSPAVQTGGFSVRTDKTPRWFFTVRGANLKAYCYNPNCEAYKHPIYIGLGYGNLYIAKNGHWVKTDGSLKEHKHHCPACGQVIDPVSILFTDCHYRMKGRKIPPSKQQFITPWESQDATGWVMYDEKVQGLAEFSDIKTETVPYSRPKPDEEVF